MERSSSPSLHHKSKTPASDLPCHNPVAPINLQNIPLGLAGVSHLCAIAQSLPVIHCHHPQTPVNPPPPPSPLSLHSCAQSEIPLGTAGVAHLHAMAVVHPVIHDSHRHSGRPVNLPLPPPVFSSQTPSHSPVPLLPQPMPLPSLHVPEDHTPLAC